MRKAGDETTSKSNDILNKKRTRTDVTFTFLYLIFAVWIATIIYIICDDYHAQDADTTQIQENETRGNFSGIPGGSLNTTISAIKVTANILIQNYASRPASLAAYVIFGGLAILTLVAILQFAIKYSSYIAIFVFYVSILFSALKVIINSHKLDSSNKQAFPEAVLEILLCTLRLIFYGMVLVFVNQVGVPRISEVIKRAFRAMFFYRSLLLLVLTITALHVLLLALTIRTLSVVRSDVLWCCVVCLGYLYTISVVWSFGNMVIAQAVATWHWSSDGKRIPSATLLRCIVTVGRNHFGSIAFSATIVLPVVLAIFIACRYTFKTAQRYQCVLIPAMCKVFFIMNIGTFSEIAVAVHGYGYYTAAKRSFRLLVKNCTLAITVTIILDNILRIATMTAFSLSFLLVLHDMGIAIDEEIFLGYLSSLFKLSAVYNTTLFFAAILLQNFLLYVYSGVYTTLVCKLEDDEERKNEAEDTVDAAVVVAATSGEVQVEVVELQEKL